MRGLAPLFLLIGATSAHAQKIETKPEPVRITLSGRLELDGVLRDSHLNECSFWTPGGIDDVGITDSFIAPLLRLRLDVEFSKQLDAVVELGNLRINFDTFDPRLQNHRLGDDDIRVHATQAFVRVRAWPVESLETSVGLLAFHRDPSGWGHPIFLSNEAESAWGELPDSTVPPFPASGTNTVPQTRRDELIPAGAVVALTLDRFRASLWLFPAMIEGGTQSADEALYGLDASYDFGPISAGAVVALLQGGTPLPNTGSSEQFLVTAGLWARGQAGIFDAFLELYRQFGTAGVDLDAKGYALRAGARLRFEVDWSPWLAVEFLWISGDESALDSDEGRFLSYENNDAAPIVEGNEFGLDVDSNYRAVRGSGGATVKVFSRSLELRTALSWFQLVERVPLDPDPPFGVSGTSDRLGIEWDVGARLAWSKSLAFDALLGLLFASDVMAQFTRDAARTTHLVTFGVRLQF